MEPILDCFHFLLSLSVLAGLSLIVIFLGLLLTLIEIGGARLLLGRDEFSRLWRQEQ